MKKANRGRYSDSAVVAEVELVETGRWQAEAGSATGAVLSELGAGESNFELQLAPGEEVELVEPGRFNDLPARSLRGRWRRGMPEAVWRHGLRCTTICADGEGVVARTNLSNGMAVQIDLGAGEGFTVRAGSLLCMTWSMPRRVVTARRAEAYFGKLLNYRCEGPGRLVLFSRAGLRLAEVSEPRWLEPSNLLGYDHSVRLRTGTNRATATGAVLSRLGLELSGSGRYVAATGHLAGETTSVGPKETGWLIEILDKNVPFIPIKKLLGRS